MVAMDECVSDCKPIDYCVIQGSILGPLLFLVKIYKMLSNRLPASVYLFADDAVILVEGENLYTEAAFDIRTINNWLRNNMLTINIKEMKYIIVSN